LAGHRHADVVVIGGSTGGVAAALAAANTGKRVILTEETDWIGGQLTSQAVPPDEHPWIEQFGCTASYREFRNGVRDYYKRMFPVLPGPRSAIHFNPGNAIVSSISHEPRAALAVLRDMLALYIHNGRLTVLEKHKVESAEVEGDQIRSVTVRNAETGDSHVLTAAYFLDATDEGELLPLANIEYITGSESIAQTGEPHALSGDPDPSDMQAITWCFAMDHIDGDDFTIGKPEQYDFWRQYQADFWPDKMLSWSGLGSPYIGANPL